MSAGRPLSVLHVLGRLQRGGAEMRTLEAMRCLDPARLRLDFCCLSGRSGVLDESARALGADVHLLRLNLAFALRFRSLLRRRGYDVVHSHVHRASGAILAVAAWAGVRVRIAQLHNTSDSRGSGPLRRLKRRGFQVLLERHASAITAVSEGVMSAVMGPRWREDPRTGILYEGVDLSAFAAAPERAGVRAEFGWPPEARICLHVGRFDPPKNHGRLLEIFASIAAAEPRARLLLAGDADTAAGSQARRRAGLPDLAGRVTLAGVRTDVPRLMLAADLLLFPSLWEGLPGVVIEASAAGLPVLASDLPGITEIGERARGIRTLSLAEPDAVWAAAAGSLLGQDPAARKAGVDPGSAFDVETYARGLADLYAGVAPAAAVGRPPREGP